MASPALAPGEGLGWERGVRAAEGSEAVCGSSEVLPEPGSSAAAIRGAFFFSIFKLAIWPRACLHGAAGAAAPCSSPRSLQAGGAAAVGSWSCGFPISPHPAVGQGQPYSTRAGGAACWGGRATGLGQNEEPGAGVSPWLRFWGAGAGFEPLFAEGFWCQALIFDDPTAVAPVPPCTAGQDPAAGPWGAWQ